MHSPNRWSIPAILLSAIALLSFASAQRLGAEEFRRMQYEEQPADNIIIDREDRGLLIVESSVPKLKFIGSNRPIPAEPGVKETMPGVWRVYLSVGTTLLTIQADGYVPIQDIRINLQPRQAKKIIITSSPVFGAYGGFDVNRPEIRLIYQPVSADERILGGLDGNVMRHDFSPGRLVLRPAPGRHTVKLNSGGRIWTKEYDLQEGQSVEDSVVFAGGRTERWDLKEPGGLVISSNPSGATVFINQIEQGATPLTLDELQPGEYRVEILKDLYLAAGRTIEVKSLEYADLQIDLTPNFGRVKIESVPSEAMVWINGRQRGTTPLEIPRFNAGKYTLRIVQNLYYDLADTFEIKPGGEFIHSYLLKPQFGKVVIASAPPGAEVTLDGALWGKTPLTRDRVLSGEHAIRLTLENYFDEDAVIRVNDGEPLEKSFTLRPSVGWLTVVSEPPGARVTLMESHHRLGLTPLKDVPVERGAYNLLVELDKYEPYEIGVALTYGGRESVDARLVRSAGHLRVSTEPQGAKIFLDGVYKDNSPTVLKDVPTGAYEIRLEKGGYDIHLGRVRVNRNEVAKYNQTLGTAGTRVWLKRRTQARLIAIIAPSGGQFHSRQYVRGVLYAGAFVGGAAMAYLAYLDHDEAKKDYWNAVDAYHSAASQTALDRSYLCVQGAIKKMNDANDRYLYSLAAVGGVYAMQLLDAWLWGGGKKPVSSQLGVAPGEVRLALSIPVEVIK